MTWHRQSFRFAGKAQFTACQKQYVRNHAVIMKKCSGRIWLRESVRKIGLYFRTTSLNKSLAKLREAKRRLSRLHTHVESCRSLFFMACIFIGLEFSVSPFVLLWFSCADNTAVIFGRIVYCDASCVQAYLLLSKTNFKNHQYISVMWTGYLF